MDLDRRDFLKLGGAALAATLTASGRDRVPVREVVLIELAGGNDGLATLVPFASEAWRRARPTLAPDEREVVPLAAGLGLAAALAPLLPFWEEGRLALVQGVGLPWTCRSHFEAREQWRMAALGLHECTATEAVTFAARMQELACSRQRLRAHVVLHGFDTHSDQRTRLPVLHRALAEGLADFARAMQRSGRFVGTRVVVHSEFGRRVTENRSAGTDHGGAGPVLVLGGSVCGGLFGAAPTEAELLRGELAVAIDQRDLLTRLFASDDQRRNALPER